MAMTSVLSKRICFLIVAFISATFLLAMFLRKPRVLAVNEVPIAFWAWRTNAPDRLEIDNAYAATESKTLFLRAGQFDLVANSVERIREVSGDLPTGVEIHLVYNATRDLLAGWSRLETTVLANKIAETYRADLARGGRNSAQVRGLQLDLDIPTRLLPEYARMLATLRSLLPSDTSLSITGLPTWTDANEVQLVLHEVDFWIPQCYGGKIPTHLDQRIPISTPADVERTIAKVRRLGKSFYAGLSAYSYAILYARNGSIVELRGNIDPARAVIEPNLELIERGPFSEGSAASGIRYAYRAQADLVLDGLVIHKNETLVFDVPTAESLRVSARVVRENAGELLRGICLFRLPSAGDLSMLGVAEIRAALADVTTQAMTTVTVNDSDNHHLVLQAANDGNASSVLGDGAFTADVPIESGSIEGLSDLALFDSYETLCDGRPCSSARANLIRLKASSWRPGNIASARIRLKRNAPSTLQVLVTTHIDDGRTDSKTVELQPIRGKKNES